VHIANNGQEAVTAVQKNSYDLILMDVQMPLINGYEATKKIRQFQQHKKRHIPIIGLTANAMNGDRQKCLDAGMDDYLSKPVRMQNLLAVIASMELNGQSSKVKKTGSTDTIQLKVGVDELLNKLGGNRKVVAGCLNLFHKEIPPILNQLDAAFKARDLEEIKTACHGLRGSLLTMEMYEAARVAEQIEHLAERNQFKKINKHFFLLKKEIKEAADYIGNV
jgi:CheY-like chemotaxis protein